MNEAIPRATLELVDPIFKNAELEIFVNKAVLKIGTKGRLSMRYLILSTAGIHMIRRRPFRRVPTIVDVISFYDLQMITVDRDRVSFKSSSCSIRFMNRDGPEIAVLAYYVKQCMFPPSLMPVEFNVGKSLAHFSSTKVLYNPRNVSFDRLLSCALHMGIDISMQNSTEYSYIIDHVYTVTNEIANNAIMPVLMTCLAFEEDLRILEFGDVYLGSLLPFCNVLLCGNKFIKKIAFKSTYIVGAAEKWIEVMAHPHIFRPTEIEFVDIKFEDGELLRAMDTIGTEFTVLAFRNCEFCGESLFNIIDIVLEYKCWKKLDKLVIEGIRDCNIQTMVQKLGVLPITEISISDCDINGANLLNGLMHSFSSLKIIRIPIGEFLSLVKAELPTENKISLLDLSGCTFSKDSLVSLLRFMGNSGSVGMCNLSSMKIVDVEDFGTALSAITDIDTKLEGLIFNDNEMMPEHAKIFAEFIVRQSKLVSLSINNCINIRYQAQGLMKVLDAIVQSDIVNLSIGSNGNKEFTYGRILNSFLKKASNHKRFQFLDLTNQQIMEDGITWLINVVRSGSLRVLMFDGLQAPSFDLLFELCRAVLDSKIQYSVCPVHEFERLIGKMVSKKDTEMNVVKLIPEVSSKFVERFNAVTKEYYMEILLDHPPENLQPDVQGFNMDVMMRRDPDLGYLVRECVQIGGDSDPLVKTLTEFSHELSLELLAKHNA